MRYIERSNKKIGGIILVAGFFNLPYLKTDEEKMIAKPWLENPINTEKIKENVKETIAVFSDNDSNIPLSDKDLFKEKLGAKIIIKHGKGHFTKGSGVEKLPIVLEEILRMSKT